MKLDLLVSVYYMMFMFLACVVFLFSFISKRKHLLGTLLSLEGLMLMMFGVLMVVSSSWWMVNGFIMVFLVLVACEGALGLSLMVVMVRSFGSDQFTSLNSLQC